MRRTLAGAALRIGRSGPRSAVLAAGLVLTVVLAGCATEISGTAVAPTSIPSSRTSATVASMPTGTSVTSEAASPRESSSTDETSSAASTDDSPTSQETTTDTTTDATSGEATSGESPSTDQSSASSGATLDPKAFAAKLKTANAGVNSLRGSITVAAGPVNVSGTFGETLTGGRVNALDMSMFISQGSNEVPLRMLIVDDKVYVGGAAVLKSIDAGGKKWALASTTSKNSTLRTLANQLDGYLGTASANQYELYAVAATSIVDDGPEKLGAVAAHRYTLTVDVKALAEASPASTRASMEALAQAGITTLPATLWLDDSGRLVQSESTVKAGGVTSRSDFKVTGYNVPVKITAPAAADVFTG